MKIMLIAGEASGDLYGSYLAKEIKKIRNDITLFGMGGVRMEKEGVSVLFPISCDVIGLGAIFKIPKAIFLLNEIINVIKKEKPEKIVLIDFSEFNLNLLKRLIKMKIKTIWLFPPTAWIWRKKRANIVKKADLILSTIPIERDFYEKTKANVLFIGHPLLDIVKWKNIPKKRPIISFLPGSRECEVKRHLPIMVEVAKRFPNNIDFFLILGDRISKDMVSKYIHRSNISIVKHSYDIMGSSDLIITSSGTSTLEGAILGVPMIVIYKMDSLSFFIAKALVKTKYISLPNIITGCEIIKEFLQNEANPKNITEEAISILNTKKGKKIKEGLYRIKELIGPPGALERAANAIINLD